MIAKEFIGVVPNAQCCYQLLVWLEEAYRVSVGFWLAVDQHPACGVDFWCYLRFSGGAADRIAPADQVLRSRILQAENGSLYPALWANLTQLESVLSRVERPRIERPSLGASQPGGDQAQNLYERTG